MSDKIYDVPAEWKKRAFIDDAKYQEMYTASIADPDAFWAEQAKRITWMKPFTKVKNTSYAPDNVSIKWFEDGTLNVAYNCIDRHLPKRANQTAIIWEGDDPEGLQADHLSGAARRGVPHRQHPAQPQRQEGRPRHHLHADDSGGGLRDAGLRADRRGPLGGVRRLLAGLARRPHRGLQVERRHHRRRRRARRPQDSAEGQHRRGDRQGRGGSSTTSSWCKRTGGAVDMEPGRDVWYHEAADGGDQRLPVRGDERGGSAVHPLHLGLDRQAEGRAAHHRRLHGLHVDHASIRVRLSRRRHLLVHRRRRLGHRPQLHRVRAALQRRDHADVRGRAELSDHVALLGGHRQAQGQHLLHRADRDPRADAGRRRAGEEDVAQVAAAARLGRRADQSGSLGVVSPRGRRRPLPDRRHLVADRDRRHSDHAAARRDARSSPARRRGRSSAASRSSSMPKARCWKARRPAISASPTRGRARCAPCSAITSASSTPTSRPIRASTSPATAAAATRTATTGSPAASTTSSTSPAIAWAPPKSRARWSRMPRCRRPPWSAIRTTSRARASTPM